MPYLISFYSFLKIDPKGFWLVFGVVMIICIVKYSITKVYKLSAGIVYFYIYVVFIHARNHMNSKDYSFKNVINNL